MKRIVAMFVSVLLLTSLLSCKEKTFNVRFDLESPSQIKIIEESGAKITNIYPAYMIAKVTAKQFDQLVEKNLLVVKLPDMDKVYLNPTSLKETNHAIYMEVYRTVWDFIGFKPHLTKKYDIPKIMSGESFDKMERWLVSFYSFKYELDKNVVEEIRKDEKIKEEAIEEMSGPITNSYTKIDTKEEFKKLLQEMKEPNVTKFINLTEKYFTGIESSDIFLVVQLKTTPKELEVTIIDYRLVLSVIEKKH